jgi:hypothetical protein
MRCFMIAVSQASTLDRWSNTFSLFLLFEQFRPASYPARLAVFSHAFFEVDAAHRDVEHEVRLVVARESRTVFATEPVTFKPTGERHRVRVHGLEIPEPGLYRVVAEWRVKGGADWARESVDWPLRAEVPVQ